MRFWDGYAELYGRAERALFADLARGGDPAALKSDYLIRFGLTARQFNAMAINLKGKIASIRERRDGLIEEAKARIKTAEQVIAKLDQALSQPLAPAERHRRLSKRHQKQRRLARWRARLAQLEADRAEDRVRLCFGGRRRFHAQFDLDANGYTSLDEWRADWQRARSSQFFVIGSKDETGGCQGCVAEYLGGSASPCGCGCPQRSARPARSTSVWRSAAALRHGSTGRGPHPGTGHQLSLPARRQGLAGVRHHAGAAVRARERPAARSHWGRSQRRSPGGVRNRPCWQSDCRADDPLVTYGLDRDQTQAAIGDAIKSLMDFARDKGKPLAIEKLDFSAKKAALEDEGRRYARMLSALAYDRASSPPCAPVPMTRDLKSSARNPAYTSVIGREKFAGRYGLSPHHAAALVIARRALNLSERPNRRARTARPLPARNRGRHVWSFWRQVAQAQRRMDRAGSRSQDRSRSPPAPRGTARAETSLPVAGATPAREASAALFG
jgi:hypothetical protein